MDAGAPSKAAAPVRVTFPNAGRGDDSLSNYKPSITSDCAVPSSRDVGFGLDAFDDGPPRKAPYSPRISIARSASSAATPATSASHGSASSR